MFLEKQSVTLQDSDVHSLKSRRKSVCVLRQNQDRDFLPRLDSTWSIRYELGLPLAQEAEEKWKPVVSFSVEDWRERKDPRNQYVLPFQRIAPPAKTRKGRRSV